MGIKHRRTHSLLGALFLVVVCTVSITAYTENESPKRLSGICFSPIRINQDPDCGVLPSITEIIEELAFIKESGIANRLRTYSSLGSFKRIPFLCNKIGIECWPGAWLGKSSGSTEREIQSLISIGKQKLRFTPVLIVGNEVLLRKDMSENQLIDAILRVKKETGLPVAYAEIADVWLQHPKVVEVVDVVLVHLYPYWDGVSIDKAVNNLIAQWKKLRMTYPGVRMMIGETGWPSAGETNRDAIPSLENQSRYFGEFIQASRQHDIEYFYFALFCEEWKAKQEGNRGAHWGIFSIEGMPNPLLTKHLPTRATYGMKRLAGMIPEPQVLRLPAFIYREGNSEENRFHPTNWMGDIDALAIDEHFTVQPRSGNECLKIEYTGLGGEGWAAIYWIGPYMNHWGDYPGYTLSEARKLVIWARGQKGGEIVEFKVGGLRSPGKPFHDSFGPLNSGKDFVQLTTNWVEYSIDLTGADTSSLLGGFCIALNTIGNPQGCMLFLDDVVIVGKHAPPPPLPLKQTLGLEPGFLSAIPNAIATVQRDNVLE